MCEAVCPAGPRPLDGPDREPLATPQSFVVSLRIAPMPASRATLPHRIDVFVVKWRLFEQIRSEMSEIPVRISCWRDALVHLEHEERRPRHLFHR